MPKGTPPDELREFLRRPNPCVIATRRPDGDLHTAATWYLWQDDGTILVNMDASRRRLEHMRADPHVALTILDESNWYSHVSVIGRVRELRPDPELADIDRIATHYTGNAYRDRNRDSWSAIVEVERWHAWGRFTSG